ncbi:MAG: hypothetical protein P1U89_21590 [Verrucomicrobiales bacterium]|nr:hypothetical protein [Verrucomicrobiales bacterium]
MAQDDNVPRSFLGYKRVLRLIKTLLTQGASPRRITLAILVGIGTGLFPILGTPSILGLASGLILKLNQPVIHGINTLCMPLHIGTILPFIRMGEKLFSADPIAFSFPVMLEIFFRSPAEFFSLYGMTCLHCIAAWAVSVPFLLVVLYPGILGLIRKTRPAL